jgi:hypothetical protein
MSSTIIKRHVPRPQVQPKPLEEQRVDPTPPAREAEPEPHSVAPYQEFPRELTFEEVCAFLDMNPSRRKFFVNRRGEYVRSLIERHVWSVDESRQVRHIPKWFIEGKNADMGQQRIYFPGKDSDAQR